MKRRSFLKLLGSVGVAATIAPPILAKPAKPNNKYTVLEQYDLDGDGELEDVYVKVSDKKTRKSVTTTRTYFDMDWQYLGQEVTVDGEVMMDTFGYN